MKDRKFPTLYKVDIKGNIRHWTIATKGASFYTEAGMVGDEYKVMKSKATETVEKIVDKKNYVSAEDQAEEEAMRLKSIELDKAEQLDYSRNRQAEYPPMEDQLDYIYHNGVDKWKTDMIDPVKNKYPKE